MVFPWKQRLYAFLLRRVLGPYLSQSSLQKLESIEVSIQEGRFVFRDLELREGLLTQKILEKAPKLGLEVTRARVRTLRINLWLTDGQQEEDGEAISKSSLAWRAMNLGSEDDGIALVAHIEIDGMELHVGVRQDSPSPADEATQSYSDQIATPGEGSSKGTSMLSSYVDAALASLRLSLELKEPRVRLCTNLSSSQQQWVEFQMDDATYHPVDSKETSSDEATTRVALHKALEFSGFMVRTGEDSWRDDNSAADLSTKQSVLAKTDGKQGHIVLRVLESTSENESIPRRIQQDLEIKLIQQLYVSADEESLKRIFHVSTAMLMRDRSPTESKEKGSPAATMSAPSERRDLLEQTTTHDEEMTIMQDIMQQFQEARDSAESNLVRGGILLPEMDNGMISFDAFFDANDQSFSQYASMLEESKISLEDGSQQIRSQIRIYMRGIQAKLNTTSSEYALFTLNEISVAVSDSDEESTFSFIVSHAVADASMTFDNRDDIYTMISFEESHSEEVVSAAPCVAIESKTIKVEGSCRRSLEVRIEPIEFFFYPTLLYQLSSLISNLSPLKATTPRDVASSSTSVESETYLEIMVTFPSIRLLIPLRTDFDGNDPKTMKGLFSRCGYTISDESVNGRSYLGIALDNIALSTLEQGNSFGQNSPSGEHENHSTTGHLVSCRAAVAFVTCPRRDMQGRIMRTDRVDLLALMGSTPISIRHLMGSNGSDSVALTCFPEAPSISSFKARQEDDDDLNSSLIDNMYGEAGAPNLNKYDGQPQMLREVSQCFEVVDINVPDLSVDLTIEEITSLMIALNWLVDSFPQRPPERSEVSSAIPPVILEESTLSPRKALSVRFGQVNAFVHSVKTDQDRSRTRKSVSFALIGDKFNAFIQTQNTNKLMRCSAQGFDIHYAESLVATRGPRDDILMSTSIERCCDNVHRRMHRRDHTRGYPILHVSHLFPPLSPNCPSLMLDVLESDHGSDRTLHFSMYNLTYRYYIDSDWIEELQLIFGSLQGSRHDDIDTETPVLDSTRLTRVFVTMADCNVDYSSSPVFEEASRTIVRFSEIRLSSNIISPRPSKQAIRVSVGDVSLQITNTRYPHHFENARLSRVKMLLSESDIRAKGYGVNSSEAMRMMNLVTILSLDALNASVIKNLDESKIGEPRMVASITFGSLNIYGCKDSFGCFTSTVSELSLKLTALPEMTLSSMFEKQREKNEELTQSNRSSSTNSADDFFDSTSHEEEQPLAANVHQQRQETFSFPMSDERFELDGYDWTTIDHDFSKDQLPPGEDNVAKWYGAEGDERPSMLDIVHDELSAIDAPGRKRDVINIIPHHVGLNQVPDPLMRGDMDAKRHAGTSTSPSVKTRLLIRDLKLRCRFFDGYDWPQALTERTKKHPRKYAFIIDEPLDPKPKESSEPQLSKKSALMGELLQEGSQHDDGSTFQDIPLSEERGKKIRDSVEERRLARRMHRFLQISLSGLMARMDSFDERFDHRLASCLDLKVADLFVAETVSQERPVKLLGEWLNETDHPRDSNDGIIMMKMVTWNPLERVSKELEIANDEARAVLHLLPLRCYVDQKAIRFASTFFVSDKEKDGQPSWAMGLKEIPAPVFQQFKVKSCKLKVDYSPEKVDVSALRDGAIVELVNLSPINDMVIILSVVEVENKVGFGACVGQLVSSWISDIVQTQVYKFVTNSSPFQPITGISGGVADMVILPWDAIQNGDDVKRALRSGIRSALGSVAFETLNATAKLTNMAAQRLATRKTLIGSGGLPSRPPSLPRGVGDTAGHAINSMAKGVEVANYKVVIVPYRELQSKGVASAARSMVTGLPVAILAPLGAASEAVSYTLLGARNVIRPDIRREEEASQKGLSYGEL